MVDNGHFSWGTRQPTRRPYTYVRRKGSGRCARKKSKLPRRRKGLEEDKGKVLAAQVKLIRRGNLVKTGTPSARRQDMSWSSCQYKEFKSHLHFTKCHIFFYQEFYGLIYYDFHYANFFVKCSVSNHKRAGEFDTRCQSCDRLITHHRRNICIIEEYQQ